jgi:class 3 adenylate cyclase/tetratricopeptide (TPR) repeat protein
MKRAIVTVVKADISGSTPLAEKLDPEELRGILGTYFAALAAQIHRYGGSVDKYIGDAVMAVFGLPQPRTDDAARATHAALGMIDAIARENATLEKRYGIRLSLRVGLNTGELVAPETGELTLMGDVVSVAEGMEAAAPLNTALMSESTFIATRGRFRTEDGPAVKVKGRAEAAPSHRPIASAVAPVADTVVPGRERSASLQVSSDREDVLREERKVVSVLFADVVVTSGRLGPDVIRPVLNAYFGDVAREIQHYGGTIDKYVGDAVMAVFGAPVSHDDDGARAIAAGLGIQSALARRNPDLEREHGVRLAARVGVNTGEVVAGLLHGEVPAYTVTGDAVNTAQRIESAAQPGEVLASEASRDLARHAFVYEAVAPLTLKGKAQPVPAFRVVRRERRASPREGTPLVGREDELARLRALLASALGGTSRLAHLHGEPGVGKTRLVGELLNAMPREAARLRARCASYEVDTPYALVADILRRSAGLSVTAEEEAVRAALSSALSDLPADERAAALAVFLEVLGFAAASALTPEAKRRLIVARLRAFLERRARAGLAVVLEDLHWLDPASADALREVTAAMAQAPCLFLTTSRDDAAPWAAEVIELRPLQDASASSMIERLAPSLDEDAKRLILERTAGNPFFIEEITHALASGRTAAVPLTVQDLLESRLDALAPDPRLVAQHASVIGRRFGTRVLARVTPEADIEPALATLEDERFIDPREVTLERTYIFRHALVQEVVYRTQLIVQRKRAHVSVGDAYRELYESRVEEFVDVLAYHYGRGDDDPKALTWLSRAGDRARSLYANAEAIAYYRTALERAAPGEGPVDAGTLLERIGDVQLAVGSYDDAIATFEQARGRIVSPTRPTDARLHRKVAQARRAQGQYDEAFAAFERARTAIANEEHLERAWIELGIGRLHHLRGDYERARQFIGRGLEHAELIRDELGQAEALQQLGNVAVRVGDAREAVDYYRRSRDAFLRLENLPAIGVVRINLGIALTRLAQYDEAQTELEAALATARRMGDNLSMGHCLNNLGDVHREAGRPRAAVDAYTKAIEAWSPIGYRSGVAVALIGLGDANVRAGRAAEGKLQLEDALARYEALGTTPYHAELYRFLAEAELALGDLGAAERAAERSTDFARAAGARHHAASALRIKGKIAFARGDAASARVLLEESRATLEELGEAGELAMTVAELQKL